jgi:hypothetical protein
MIDDVLEGCEDPVGEPVVAHELPDVLHRVEFGTRGWQRDDADIGRDLELAVGVPATRPLRAVLYALLFR